MDSTIFGMHFSLSPPVADRFLGGLGQRLTSSQQTPWVYEEGPGWDLSGFFISPRHGPSAWSAPGSWAGAPPMAGSFHHTLGAFFVPLTTTLKKTFLGLFQLGEIAQGEAWSPSAYSTAVAV